MDVHASFHQTRGKAKNARRAIALDDTTLAVLAGWRAHQAAEFTAVGITNEERGCSPTATASPSIPTPFTKRSAASFTTPRSRRSNFNRPGRR